MSVIVKLSDGSRIRVKGVNSEAELREQCEALLDNGFNAKIDSVEEEFCSDFSDCQPSQAHTDGVCDYSDWRQVYNEEIRRGLGTGKGHKNEPTGKAKPRRLATDRKWRWYGITPWGKD